MILLLFVCALLSVSLFVDYAQLKPTSDVFHTPVIAVCVIQHLCLHFRHAPEKSKKGYDRGRTSETTVNHSVLHGNIQKS